MDRSPYLAANSDDLVNQAKLKNGSLSILLNENNSCSCFGRYVKAKITLHILSRGVLMNGIASGESTENPKRTPRPAKIGPTGLSLDCGHEANLNQNKKHFLLLHHFPAFASRRRLRQSGGKIEFSFQRTLHGLHAERSREIRVTLRAVVDCRERPVDHGGSKQSDRNVLAGQSTCCRLLANRGRDIYVSWE